MIPAGILSNIEPEILSNFFGTSKKNPGGMSETILAGISGGIPEHISNETAAAISNKNPLKELAKESLQDFLSSEIFLKKKSKNKLLRKSDLILEILNKVSRCNF